MKQSLLLSFCALSLTAASALAALQVDDSRDGARKALKTRVMAKSSAKCNHSARAKQRISKAPEKLPFTNGEWVAQEMKQFYPDGEGDWIEAASMNSTYDAQGRIVSDLVMEEEEEYHIDYSYSEDGYECTIDTYAVYDGEQVLETRQVRAYDPQTPGLLVKSLRYSYDYSEDDELSLEPTSYYREVDRNADGSITAVHYFTYYLDHFEEVQRVTVEYGEDGKASSVTEWQLAYNDASELYWQEGYSYRSIQWYKTDGQIYDLDCVYEGENKAKSASQFLEGEWQCDINATFVGDTDSFTAVAIFPDEGYRSVQEWTVLPNEGYQNEIALYPWDDEELPDEYEPETVDYEIKQVEREEYDVLGNLTLAYAYEDYGNDEIVVYDWMQAESVLNAQGLPESVTLRGFYPEDEWGEWDDEDWYRPSRVTPALTTPPVEGTWEDMERAEYSGFIHIDPSSVGTVASPDAVPVYYSIDGRRLQSLPDHGLVIERRGTAARKILR